MNSKIWLSSPHMGGTELNYIKEAFDNNWIAPLGPNVDAFEMSLENYLSDETHVACLSSGTAAIHLALNLLKVGVGDEVLCQSFTFCGSAYPILYCGATPVFIDSENESWNMCPVVLEQAILDRLEQGKQPKAIIFVHLYGMPAKVDEILELSKKYNIPLIEDAAEALGSTFKGQKCGTFGDYAVLSFNGNKIITTSGGGALVCKSIEEKEKAIFYSTQARDYAPHYQHSELGYNYRMSNVLAGIGRGQIKVLDNHVQLRRQMHDFYNTIFEQIPGVELFKEPCQSIKSNHWLSCILIEPKTAGFTNEQLRLKLLQFNIESRPLWKPMHLQPIFKQYPSYGTGVAEILFDTGLCLPSGSNLTDYEKNRIKQAILS